MDERSRCLEAYHMKIQQRPPRLTLEQGNRYLQDAQVTRDRCLAAIEAGNVCHGHHKPTEGPSMLKKAGINYRPEGYKCTAQGWVYKINEDEAFRYQAYENSRPVNWVTAKCQDYSTAIINGVTHHVWDRCSKKPYVIHYETNRKITLRADWWKTPEGRQHTENQVTGEEEHVSYTPTPDSDPDPIDPKVPWWDICSRFIGPLVGKQKACKVWDVTCHGENVTKRVTGSLGHMACWAGIGIIALVLVLFALFGRKKATTTILHVAKEGATTGKHAAKAAAK